VSGEAMRNSHPFCEEEVLPKFAEIPTLIGVCLLMSVSAASFSAERTYWIAAEDAKWDFAPTGKNQVHCMEAPAPCALPSPYDKAHTAPMVRYIEYTNGSFSDRKPQPSWLGIMGPILRAEVGDIVTVHFCNHAKGASYGMHPHGLRYTKPNEGAFYYGAARHTPPGDGAAIAPGDCFDYRWIADDDSGPAAGDVSSKVWWYHSHVHESLDTNLGLLGPVIVTRKGSAKANGAPKDVDREFVLSFFIYITPDFKLMNSINGYIFGNLRSLTMYKGEKVRWHVLGMGDQFDIHTTHWHGKTLTVGADAIARRTDVIELLPGSMVTADMQANNPGEWLLHCHVAAHLNGGMVTTYQILNR
jgi:manganese oxidase